MRRRNRKNSKNSYGNLEPRVMLTADLDVARSLIANGSFEDADSTAFFAFADGEDGNQVDPTIRELTTNFSRVAQVDTDAGQVDSLAQDIETRADTQYIISFDLRGRNLRDGDAADTNDVEVLFGGESLGVFRAESSWQTVTVSATASGERTRLEFREASADSDGRGIFVDHVAVAGIRPIDVINGSFEEVNNLTLTGAVPDESVLAWNAINESGDELISILRDDPADGDLYLNLNSSDTTLDRIFTNVATEADGLYFVTFQLRNGDPEGNRANLRLRWNGEHAGSFVGGEDWKRVGAVVTGQSEFSTLMFRERGSNTGNGLDAQIDDLQIFKIDSITSDYVLDLNGSETGMDIEVEYVENSDTVISDALRVRYSNGEILQSATARIQGFTGSERLDAVTDGTNIEASFNGDNGILRLVGRDTAPNYQAVLRTLTFTDSNDDPGADLVRELTLSVTDGTIASPRRTAMLPVTAVNDAAIIEAIPDVPLTENAPLTINVPANDPDGDDADLVYDIAVSGQSFIFGDDDLTISQDGEIVLEAVTHGDATVTVTVTDGEGAQSEESFDVSVAFVAPTGPIPGDFVPFSGQRQLSDSLPLSRNDVYTAAPPQNIDLDLNYWAYIETPDGEIVIDLFEDESPITVNNFVNLAEDGFYDGVIFHRVIEDFVAQGGDPTGTGTGGPGYQFVDELNNGLGFEGVGQLAMANSGPNTNGSQFFFTLNENPSFAGQHTIFGEITEGLDILSAINFTTGDPDDATLIERIRIETTA